MPDRDDHVLAAELARRAGELLVELRADLLVSDTAPGAIKDAGDRASHELLMRHLRDERPSDSILSEEAREDEQDTDRVAAERVWIIDPLDGTREYGENRADWAVHVALVEGGIPTAAAVALPALGLVLSTLDPPELPPSATPPRVIVSRSRPPTEALTIASALGSELIEMGSAGAKAMAIIRGLADVYPHSGGQYEWDSAAPVGVATAAGLHCSRIDGSPLLYNQPDPYLPDLLICRPAHVEPVLAAIR